MPGSNLPAPKFRSPTAVQDEADVRDDHVYSAIVLAYGGNSPQTIFTVPKGQAIPEMLGSANSATTQPHQAKYSDLTTNFSKAGEAGSAIGDFVINKIGLCIEQASFTATSGAAAAYGATEVEVAEILAKVSFELKIAGKKMISGAVNMFPSYGGAAGSISTTGNGATVALSQNGYGRPRTLSIPIQAARTDTIEAIFATGNGASLVFSVASTVGQPCLVWTKFDVTVAGDAR